MGIAPKSLVSERFSIKLSRFMSWCINGNIFIIPLEWSDETFGNQTDFELSEAHELNQKQGKFYAKASPKPGEKGANQMSSDQAMEYHKNSYKSIRSAINRHLRDLERTQGMLYCLGDRVQNKQQHS